MTNKRSGCEYINCPYAAQNERGEPICTDTKEQTTCRMSDDAICDDVTFETIDKRVYHWARERSLFKESNPTAQYGKLVDEVTELGTALVFGDENDVIDAIGDIMVVLSIISRMHSTNLCTCYDKAYNQIKDRKGRIENGIFVKEKE